MKTLKEWLSTREGCAHVAAELVAALDNYGMIAHDVQGVSEGLVRSSDLVLHVVKSRETREGWIAVRFTPEGKVAQ